MDVSSNGQKRSQWDVRDVEVGRVLGGLGYGGRGGRGGGRPVAEGSEPPVAPVNQPVVTTTETEVQTHTIEASVAPAVRTGRRSLGSASIELAAAAVRQSVGELTATAAETAALVFEQPPVLHVLGDTAPVHQPRARVHLPDIHLPHLHHHHHHDNHATHSHSDTAKHKPAAEHAATDRTHGGSTQQEDVSHYNRLSWTRSFLRGSAPRPAAPTPPPPPPNALTVTAGHVNNGQRPWLVELVRLWLCVDMWWQLGRAGTALKQTLVGGGGLGGFWTRLGSLVHERWFQVAVKYWVSQIRPVLYHYTRHSYPHNTALQSHCHVHARARLV